MEAGRAIVDAIETLLRESGPKTRDMGGQAGTADVGKAHWRAGGYVGGRDCGVQVRLLERNQ